MDKAGVRRRVLARRAALSPDRRATAAAAVHGRLERLSELAGARAVMGYAAFGSELDLDPYLQRLLERELGVFLPRVDGSQLQPVRINDLAADLAPGWRGVREPRSARTARSGRLDAVLVPGVAFDPRGGRLGYGGGHFDRFLAALPARTVTVGVAFDEQIVAAVPAEGHDVAVQLVVTPTRVLVAAGEPHR